MLRLLSIILETAVDTDRVPVQVMSCHGVYLSKFLAAHHLLLHSDTAPLPQEARHMVATMAAARLACSYLTHHHRTQLRLLGRGDTAEAGLAAFPAKVNMNMMN